MRVACRKPSTFRIRVGAALVAFVIGGGLILLATLGNIGFGTGGIGTWVFATLTWLSLAATLTAGLFFTSDCLSEEKREGTMGLLFLTDLRGYDVVLGKLLATSLRSFYALLAVFPIVGITLMLGGVTGAHFWKTALALVNALFFSLAVGLVVSAISRESQKALAATVLALLLFVAGGPLTDGILAYLGKRPFNPLLSLFSPGYLFAIAGAWGRSVFWQALLVNQIIAWSFLGLSCLVLPRNWQEKAASPSTATRRWARWWKFGGARRQRALREKLMVKNPALWLACRERWQAMTLWGISLLAVEGVAATFISGGGETAWLMGTYLGGAVSLVLYLAIASQACRLLVEARRTGLIELLLATPLTAAQIVQGQWRALLRMFGPPIALYLAAQLLAIVMLHMAWKQVAAAVPATPAPATVTTTAANGTTVVTTNVVVAPGTIASTGPSAPATNIVAVAVSLGSTVTVAANFIALVWFGMWIGLTSRNINIATLKTLVFVQIIPWFVITFLSSMIVPILLLPKILTGTSSTFSFVWFQLITSALSTLLALSKDIAFILWSRRRLYTQFRERAWQWDAQPLRATVPPLLRPPSIPAPVS